MKITNQTTKNAIKAQIMMANFHHGRGCGCPVHGIWLE